MIMPCSLLSRNMLLEIIERAGMSSCKAFHTPVDTKAKLSFTSGALYSDPTHYRSIAGALQYLTFTRPDISYVVQQICLYMHDPCEAYMTALKRIKLIIMAQPQRPADVHQDELCPPNKRYALMNANKKVDLENSLCLDESIILENILQNHPLRFSIAASLLVPWIYLGQFWHTLQEDGSKNKLKFMLDRKELTLTLDDFRIIFHLPQATNNNHDHFVPAPKFSEMVPFYINNLGFTLELRSTSNFKTTGLLQPWQTLCKIFSRCLTTRVTGKSKGVVGMKIPDWMITDEMKLTENYRTTRAPRTPNPEPAEVESSAPRRSTVVRLCIPPRRSTRLTPPTPIPITDEADDLVLQNTLQVSLAEQKSREELEAKQNVEKVKEHLMAEEIKKLVEGSENVEENVEVASLPLRNDDNQTNPGTRLEPRSDKESPEVENIAEISQLVNVIEEEEESAEDDYELKRREKGNHVEEIRNTSSPTTIRSPRIQSTLVSSDTEKLQELTETDPTPSSTPSSSSPKTKLSTIN
ncbi:reverse transcriptase domain-containing protein [Tanacetum coccineum]|uniref:Reverse transcriptase domain-containing protein n=1 Tax=Tanacetum coccineum TaxID=301880 RepID=A0ABQ5A306_9ASTR